MDDPVRKEVQAELLETRYENRKLPTDTRFYKKIFIHRHEGYRSLDLQLVQSRVDRLG